MKFAVSTRIKHKTKLTKAIVEICGNECDEKYQTITQFIESDFLKKKKNPLNQNRCQNALCNIA